MFEDGGDVFTFDLLQADQARLRPFGVGGLARRGRFLGQGDQLRPDGVAACQDGGAGEDVLQLADVARPVVFAQLAPGALGQVPDTGVLAGVDLLEQMLDQ